MKSSKTMYETAKALAVEHGMRSLKGQNKIVGYGLTIIELERLYSKEGFTIESRKAANGSKIPSCLSRHIDQWLKSKLVVKRGEYYFFIFDPRDFEDSRVIDKTLLTNTVTAPDIEIVGLSQCAGEYE